MVTNAWRPEDKQRYDTIFAKPINGLTREEINFMIEMSRKNGEHFITLEYQLQKMMKLFKD